MSNANKGAAPDAPGGPTTIIGSTIIIRGKLKSDEDLVVEGRIEAEISSSKALVIENSGIIKASMQVQSVRVSGVVVGNITAQAKVEIAPDGRVVGDILTPKLVIRDGAAFRGRIDMPDFDAPHATVPEAARTVDTAPTAATIVPIAATPPVESPGELARPEPPTPDPSVLFPLADDPFAPPPLPPAKPAMSADRDHELDGKLRRNKGM